MKTMKSVRVKPNPTGKDRTRHGASPAQLGAEWVDLMNEGPAPVRLDGLSLYHVGYQGATDRGTWEKVVGFTGILGARQVMRVHSGNGPVSSLHPADLLGADVHIFTGRNNYVWNNDRGDCAALGKDGEAKNFDQAWYDERPPEGFVLVRSGQKFVVPATSQAAVGGRF